MTVVLTVPSPKRKWFGLALRHLRMASRLLDSGFADGCVFHAYHAYECVLSALIAAKGYPVPPDGKTLMVSPRGKKVFGYPSPQGIVPNQGTHKARQIFFMELADMSKPYFARHSELSRYVTLDDRMDSLYYDTARDQLPHQVYNRDFAVEILPQIHLFAREVWKEIR